MIPASIRNNNPGAMYPGPSARKFGATGREVLRSRDGEHKIATFPDAVSGAAALFDLLASPAYTGRSIEAAIRKWCGGFYVSTYIAVMERETDVSRETLLTRDLLANPAVAVPIAKAMALQEAGRAFPLSDADWGAAHARVFGVGTSAAPMPASTPVEVWTPGNDLPTPKPETRVQRTLAGSRTVLGGLVGIMGVIVQYIDDAIRFALEAAAQVASWDPVTQLAATMGANVKGIGLALGVAGFALVIARRINAALEG